MLDVTTEMLLNYFTQKSKASVRDFSWGQPAFL